MTRSQFLMLIAAVCFLLAAVVVAFSAPLGPALAWAFGGFSAWTLAQSGALP